MTIQIFQVFIKFRMEKVVESSLITKRTSLIGVGQFKINFSEKLVDVNIQIIE